ncbi:MAG: glycosyltransferase family 4 protein [Planctomycetaceae bacterium]|nr:glycosyltransferase family 4 protein [Planctomycetaceae bacterium]
MEEHKDAIYVLGGLRGCKTVELAKKYIFRQNNPKGVVFSERPNLYGNFLKTKILLPLLYRYLAAKYQHKISTYFAMGKLGIETFVKYGWKRDKFYPFMYQTSFSKQLVSAPCCRNCCIKLLYVGSFDNRIKGIDILTESINNMNYHNWSLTLIGKGGDYEQQTLAWANQHENVTYAGVWKSEKVIENISQYDLCLIPSRYDGWGMVTNEALLARVGCIVSDNTGSKDLIEASGAGMLVPAGNISALTNALKHVVNNPDIIQLWKNKAVQYAEILNSNAVNEYFLDVIQYTFDNKNNDLRPACPWL